MDSISPLAVFDATWLKSDIHEYAIHISLLERKLTGLKSQYWLRIGYIMTAIKGDGENVESELEVLEFLSNDVSRLLAPSTVEWEDLRVLGDSVSSDPAFSSFNKFELKNHNLTYFLICSLLCFSCDENQINPSEHVMTHLQCALLAIAQKVTYQPSPALHSVNSACIDQRCTVQIHQGIRSSRFVRVEMREEEGEREKIDEEGCLSTHSSIETNGRTVAADADMTPLKNVSDASIQAVEINANSSSSSVGIIDLVTKEDCATCICESICEVCIDSHINLMGRSDYKELEKADTMIERDAGEDSKKKAEITVVVAVESREVVRADEGEKKETGQAVRGSGSDPGPVSVPVRHQDSRGELVLNNCLSQLIVRIPLGRNAGSRRITSNVSTSSYHHYHCHYYQFSCRCLRMLYAAAC